jgi:hypothetical protein
MTTIQFPIAERFKKVDLSGLERPNSYSKRWILHLRSAAADAILGGYFIRNFGHLYYILQLIYIPDSLSIS